jgi:hypothetical protein
MLRARWLDVYQCGVSADFVAIHSWTILQIICSLREWPFPRDMCTTSLEGAS